MQDPQTEEVEREEGFDQEAADDEIIEKIVAATETEASCRAKEAAEDVPPGGYNVAERSAIVSSDNAIPDKSLSTDGGVPMNDAADGILGNTNSNITSPCNTAVRDNNTLANGKDASLGIADITTEVKADDDVAIKQVSETEKEANVNEEDVNDVMPPVLSRTSFSQTASGLEFFSLPMDALHSISSYLTPHEWSSFGQTSKSSSRICQEIFRRARLHGFRCAMEVVSAWKMGEHEDAKELAALYLNTGVPIHPHCLGHSYHTILWRMRVESRKMNRPSSAEDDHDEEQEEVAVDAPEIDSFYIKRDDIRLHQGYNNHATYVEEKAFFYVEEKVEQLERNGMSRFASRREAQDPRRPSQPRIPMNIHQHLLDQHILGRHYVKDQDGAMLSSPMSLSVDFFHPTSYGCLKHPTGPFSVDDRPVDILSPINFPLPTTRIGLRPITSGAVPVVIDGDLDARLVGTRVFAPVAPVPPQRPNSILEKMEVRTYESSSPPSGKTDSANATCPELQSHLRTRFATYQRRLEGFLSQHDHDEFDECLLDFWDEFFPRSAGIHYFDLHTPVPRLSSLHTFLTKPLPKSLGTIQCEIERIKTTPRGKGMKGRLFPTYEYRLFIRNRPHSSAPQPESANSEEDVFVRKDTLLMVAQSRGKKHLEASGVIPISSPKKGASNYYLHMPQQSDVDSHFQRVNPSQGEDGKVPKMVPNGASTKPVIATNSSSSELLGRLQSNFIGTEFQIYTPHLQKRHRSPPKIKNPVYYSPSEDELDYDSGMSSDNGSTKKSKRFRRRKATTEDVAGEMPSPTITRPTYRRSKSCSDLPQSRPMRGKRVAIATSTCGQQTDLYEEESGAITYTANLLGSRPRIMDVCIPKVTPNGTAAAEWKTFLSNCDEEPDDCRMLRSFRQLQQNIQNHDEQDPDDDDDDDDDDNQEEEEQDDSELEDFGLLPLQNRPPWWNVELGSFVLNFGGRVSVASVKNFQLCHRHDQDNIMLQFGRIQGRHAFTMDFQHPLTAVQAFSIAISSLQSKISFG